MRRCFALALKFKSKRTLNTSGRDLLSVRALGALCCGLHRDCGTMEPCAFSKFLGALDEGLLVYLVLISHRFQVGSF